MPGSPAAPGETPGLFLLRKDSERRATLHRVLSDHIGPVVAHVQDALPAVTQPQRNFINTTSSQLY